MASTFFWIQKIFWLWRGALNTLRGADRNEYSHLINYFFFTKNKVFIFSVLQLNLVLLKCTMPYNKILSGGHPTYSYQKHFEPELFCSCKLWTVTKPLLKEWSLLQEFFWTFYICLIISVSVSKPIMILPSEGHMAVSELNKQHIFCLNINISSPLRWML